MIDVEVCAVKRILCSLTKILVFVLKQKTFCLQAEDGIRYQVRSRGRGDVYKRQAVAIINLGSWKGAIGSRPIYHRIWS